jgi:hypothetical protein
MYASAEELYKAKAEYYQKRCDKLTDALQLVAGYLDMDDAGERFAFNEVRNLLK